jgi:hypothetical protein
MVEVFSERCILHSEKHENLDALFENDLAHSGEGPFTIIPFNVSRNYVKRLIETLLVEIRRDSTPFLVTIAVLYSPICG